MTFRCCARNLAFSRIEVVWVRSLNKTCSGPTRSTKGWSRCALGSVTRAWNFCGVHSVTKVENIWAKSWNCTVVGRAPVPVRRRADHCCESLSPAVSTPTRWRRRWAAQRTENTRFSTKFKVTHPYETMTWLFDCNFPQHSIIFIGQDEFVTANWVML